MKMAREWFPTLALGVLVLAAVGIGVFATGGPETARQEKRDRAQVQALRDAVRYVDCIARADGALPDALETERLCPTSSLRRFPTTDVAITYERLGQDMYRLCTSFERPDRLQSPLNGRLHNLNPETGCADVSIVLPKS